MERVLHALARWYFHHYLLPLLEQYLAKRAQEAEHQEQRQRGYIGRRGPHAS